MTQENPCFTIRFKGSPQGVRRALSEIRNELAAAGASTDQLGRIETVIAEVLNNVVEHALADAPPSLVETYGQHQQSGWFFQVLDPGRPLPQKRLPDQRMPVIDTRPEDLPEGGFGWALVHMLTSEISYERQPGQNCLRFSIPDH